MRLIGLTGSIGMGKTATADLFARAGIPVQDADAVVRDLYAPGGAAVTAVARAFPGVVTDRAVDRSALAAVLHDAQAWARLEAIVHPLVAAARARFLAQARAAGDTLALLDVPLLLETGADKTVDFVVVASAPFEVQRARVLRRPGMTEDKFAAILARQMPDADKRARAHWVIDTGRGHAHAAAQVARVLAQIRTPSSAMRAADRHA